MFGLSLAKLAPWALLALLLVGAYAAGGRIVSGWEASIAAKRDAMWQAKIDAANAKSQALSEKLDTAMSDLGHHTDQTIKIMQQKEAPHAQAIDHEIQTDPSYRTCRVSDRVLDDRNAIRALRRSTDTGDSGIPSSTPSTPSPTE